jgi:heptosyltransferase II
LTGFKKILVVQTAFIGDAILASAALESLHKEFPGAELHILVRNGNESLFEGHPYLKKVWVWNKKQGKLRNLVKLTRAIRREKFDWLLNFHRFASSGFLTAFSGARIKSGFDKNPWARFFTHVAKHEIGNGKHEVERNFELLKPFVKGAFAKPRLYPTVQQVEKIKSLAASPFVCMAPASVWFTKQLPKEKWIELCNAVHDKKVYLLGAKSDLALCEEIRAASANRNIEILGGKLSLLESCALMARATMNYVNDSAPLHLASSVNAPVTAFFCSTVPEFGFYPLSDNSKIVSATPPPPCRPCGLHGYKACPLGHFSCGYSVHVKELA